MWGFIASLLLLSAICSSAAVSVDRRHPVCIVGAGPAGLTAAKALEDKGYRTVLFDKRDKVAGKCQSYYQDGQFYPLGAVLFLQTPSYNETFNLVQQLGVKYTTWTDTHDYLFNCTTGSTVSSPTISPETAQANSAQLADYAQVWQELSPILQSIAYKNGVPLELSMSGRDWLLKHGYLNLATVINEAEGAFGYGDFARVPALCVLRLFAPDVVGYFLGQVPGFVVDYHELIKRFAKSIHGHIHLNTTITQISPSHPVIHLTHIHPLTTAHHRPRHKPTHHIPTLPSNPTAMPAMLILAFPATPNALAHANIPLSPAETALFAQVEVEAYFASTVRMAGLPADSAHDTLTAALPDPLTAVDGQGQPVYLVPLHTTRNGSSTRLVSVYSWDAHGEQDNGCEERARELLTATLSRSNRDPVQQGEGVQVTGADVVAWSGWTDYSPHVGVEAVVDGWYEEFNRLQGGSRTYWVGGLSAFETVELAVRAGRDVVDVYF